MRFQYLLYYYLPVCLAAGGLFAQEGAAGQAEAREAGGDAAIYSIAPLTLPGRDGKEFSPARDFSMPPGMYVLRNGGRHAEIREVSGDGAAAAQPEAVIEFLEKSGDGGIYRINIDGAYYFAGVLNSAAGEDGAAGAGVPRDGAVTETYFDETGGLLFLYVLGFHDGRCTGIEKRLPGKSARTVFSYDNMNNITGIEESDGEGNVTGEYRGIYGKHGVKYRERKFKSGEGSVSETMDIQYDERGLPVAAVISRTVTGINSQAEDRAGADGGSADGEADRTGREAGEGVTAGSVPETFSEDIFVDYTYKFDEAGNWTECTSVYSKEISGVILPVEQSTVKREIVYYD